MTPAACQLLTAIDDGEKAAQQLLDPNYAAQQKFDGKRIILQVERAAITAHNREGAVCSVSSNIIEQARRLCAIAPLTLDCEWLRETRALQIFDLLEIDGTDIRKLRFDQRQAQLQRTLQIAQAPSLQAARTEFLQDGKVALLEKINRYNLEGIVLKRIDSPYQTGRQRDQFKYKFTEVSSFLITRLNEKQSVALGAFDEKGQLVNCGDVKIRNRHFKVREGMIIDVKYMHAFPSHLIYQPRMMAIRDDLQPEACTLSQLRYKGTEITVA